MKILVFIYLLTINSTSWGIKMPLETATMAGGCFWGMEEIIRNIPGVTRTVVGYTGGRVADPTYSIVRLGTSGHAESVQVEFDPKKISYTELLEFFFRMHDPTTLNQQGNDKGTQYRSAIFYHTPEQKIMALELIKKIEATKKWPRTIVTEVVAASTFYPAEEYHQDYLQKNPEGYTCHWLRD